MFIYYFNSLLSKIESCFPSKLKFNLQGIKRNNTISTELKDDEITIIKSEYSNDGIKLQTKEQPSFSITLDDSGSQTNSLYLNHLLLSFSNAPTIDNDSYDATLTLVFKPKGKGDSGKHTLRMVVLLSQDRNLNQSDKIDFISSDTLFWNILNKDNDHLNIKTSISQNLLPNEIQREGLFFIEKSDYKDNNCNSNIVSWFIQKTPVLVTNDILKLKKQFITENSMFETTKFDLISEISLVKFNSGIQDNKSIKELLDFRKKTQSKNNYKKDDYGFMRFKNKSNNSQSKFNKLKNNGNGKQQKSKKKPFLKKLNKNTYLNKNLQSNKNFRFRQNQNWDSNQLKQRIKALRNHINSNHSLKNRINQNDKKISIYNHHNDNSNQFYNQINSIPYTKSNTNNLPIAQNDFLDQYGNIIPNQYQHNSNDNNNNQILQPNLENSAYNTQQIHIKPDSDLIIEPEDSKDVNNQRLFQQIDQELERDKYIKNQSQKHLRLKQKQQNQDNDQGDYSKIHSMDDIKNFKFTETERNPYSKQSIADQESDSHHDVGPNTSQSFQTSPAHLNQFKRAQKHLNDIQTSAKKDKDTPPKGLIANFKLSSSLNPNGSTLVELAQFRSSLENIYNKGYSDALEDLGLDPRNALSPSTRDQYNHVNDIDNTNRDYGNNQRFREKQPDNQNDLSSEKLDSAHVDRILPNNPIKEINSSLTTNIQPHVKSTQEPHMSKQQNVRQHDVNDDIFDNNIKKKEEYEKKMELNVDRVKEEYQVDDHKKEQLAKIKKNIIDLGRYLKKENILDGPLQDMFNSMQDSQKSLLKSFKKQTNSVLDNSSFNENQSKDININENRNISNDRFSQLNKSNLSKANFKHKTLDNILSPDKWDKIRKQLPESRQADFNIYDVKGRSLDKQYDNIFNKDLSKGKGILDLKDEHAIQDGRTLDKKDQEVLKSTYNKLFANIKDEQQKWDDSRKYQINQYKLGFKEQDRDKPSKLNNEIKLKQTPRVVHNAGLTNVQLSADEVDAALRKKDQVHLGGNKHSDNVFRRAKLYDDSDRISTVITPTINRQATDLEWKTAKFKLNNGQQKQHDNVGNYATDFGFNKAEKNYNDYKDIDMIN